MFKTGSYTELVTVSIQTILAGIFSIIAALSIGHMYSRGVVTVISGSLFILSFFTALGLSGSNSRYIHYIALATGSIFSLGLVGCLFLIPTLSEELVLFIILLTLGCLGLLTVISLIKKPIKVISKNTE